MGMIRSAILLIVVCGVLWPTSVAAQTVSSGGIAGAVRDVSGGVLPGVTVEAESPALIEKTLTVISDGQGQYKQTRRLRRSDPRRCFHRYRTPIAPRCRPRLTRDIATDE